MNEKEFSYWMALSHDLPSWSFSNKEGWKNEDKMDVVIKFFNNGLDIIEFFDLSDDVLKTQYGLNNSQINDLNSVRDKLQNNAITVEMLQKSGVSIIPIISSAYSKTLKRQLQKSAPLLLYVKGNRKLLLEDSIAIVGSRSASDAALEFSDRVVRNNLGKVIVSGGAKGVDQQALDSSITYGGKTIIVLPQGILTYESGIKKYYKGLVDGNVLIISTFHPNTPWQKELAMARNSIIYALSEKIYVAESKPSVNKSGKATKGGTYSGVIDGLKKIEKGILGKDSILIRYPGDGEVNDNRELIKLGGVPVDMSGNRVELDDIQINPKQEALF